MPCFQFSCPCIGFEKSKSKDAHKDNLYHCIAALQTIEMKEQLTVSIKEFKYSYVQKHIVLFSATSWQLKNTLYNWLAYTFNMLNGLTTVQTAILRILQSKIEKGDPRHKKGTQIPKKVP